jgi:hypothetical protein
MTRRYGSGLLNFAAHLPDERQRDRNARSEQPQRTALKGLFQYRTAGRRALIWPTYHVVSVPAITGVHGTIASVPWIFMQAILSRERAHLPLSERCPGATYG